MMLQQCHRIIPLKEKLNEKEKNDILLPRPQTYRDIVISNELQVTNGGARFLLHDNLDSNVRLIILSCDDDLDRLSNSDHWHCDRTFKVY